MDRRDNARVMPKCRLVDDSFLARVKPGAVLVNCSRGALIDTDAVWRALTSGLRQDILLVNEDRRFSRRALAEANAGAHAAAERLARVVSHFCVGLGRCAHDLPRKLSAAAVIA